MKQWKTWLGFIISVGIIYLAFRGINVRLLIANLQQADYRYLIPIIAIIFITIALRAVRWGYLLRPVKQIGFHSLFEGILISFMANNVLPVRMGEFVRAYIIGRSERISTSASFATVVLERLFDGLTIFALFVAVLTCFQLPVGNIPFKEALLAGGAVTVAICGLTVAILVLIKARTEWVLKTTGFLIRPFSTKLAQSGISTMISFKKGLLAVESATTMVIAFCYSLMIWAIFCVAIYLMGLAFGLTLSLAATCMVLLAICLAVMIPSTPGYIGPYHASVAYALLLFNIPLEQALSFSIVFHAVNYLPVTLAGFLYLGRHHLTLKKIRAVEGKPAGK
jgi:uncharacterized protein (TIRG00374 family)